MLNRSGESRHLCPVPDFRGKALSLLLLSMNNVGSSYMAFIMLMQFPSITSFFECFIKKGC